MWKRSDQSVVKLIDSLSHHLDLIGDLPKKCDLSAIGTLQLAALYSTWEPDYLIRESVFSGMDWDQDLAILKALTECVERMAIQEGKRRGDPICLTPRSDGFAAF